MTAIDNRRLHSSNSQSLTTAAYHTLHLVRLTNILISSVNIFLVAQNKWPDLTTTYILWRCGQGWKMASKKPMFFS